MLKLVWVCLSSFYRNLVNILQIAFIYIVGDWVYGRSVCDILISLLSKLGSSLFVSAFGPLSSQLIRFFSLRGLMKTQKGMMWILQESILSDPGENVYILVDFVLIAKQKQHENICCPLQKSSCRNNQF